MKVTLSNLISLQNETSALAKLNSNNAAITAAIENTLSRDGTAPNTMSADIDMNGQTLLNLADAISNQNPVTLAQLNNIATSTGNVPAGGTTNQTLVKNSNSSFDFSWKAAPSQNLTGPITSIGSATSVNAQTGTGSTFVMQTSPTINTPTLTAPALGTPTSGTLTNVTGLPTTGLTGTLQASQFPILTGDVTTAGGSLATTIATNTVTNTKAAQMAANTLKMNSTSSTANAGDVTIPSLTLKASPAAGDFIILSDTAASGSLKSATVSSIASAGSVSSIAGNTGVFTIGGGLGNETNLLIVAKPTIPQGRLTLTTGTPVMTSSVTGATTVFYTPYNGQWVPIYDGTNFINTNTGGELSQLTTDATKSPAAVAASSVYDIFVWNDSGTIRATRGPAWTNTTTRSAGTAIFRQNGIWLNNNSITNGPASSRGTYVGTVASNGSSTIDYIFGASASGGTSAVLNVWNVYNRVVTSTTVIDSGASYAYTPGTIRQARASSNNQISFVLGLQEEGINFSYQAGVSMVAAVSASLNFGVGFDSTTTFGQQFNSVQNPAAAAMAAGSSNCGVWNSPIGVHILSANERGDAVNANTFDAFSLNALSAQLKN